MLMATRAAGLTAMVRVPATEYHFLARVLDMGRNGGDGADGRERRAGAVDRAIDKYPPAGRRGAAFGVAHDDYQRRRCHRQDEIRQ